MRRKKRSPEWPETTKPKVLLENPDQGMVWACERTLQRAGYETRSCAGPSGSRDAFPYGRCPLVENGGCALADGADVIVFGLGLSTRDGRAVLGGLRSLVPLTPVCIDAPEPEVSRNTSLVAGCTVIPFPDAGSGLVRAVRRGLAGRSDA